MKTLANYTPWVEDFRPGMLWPEVNFCRNKVGIYKSCTFLLLQNCFVDIGRHVLSLLMKCRIAVYHLWRRTSRAKPSNVFSVCVQVFSMLPDLWIEKKKKRTNQDKDCLAYMKADVPFRHASQKGVLSKKQQWFVHVRGFLCVYNYKGVVSTCKGRSVFAGGIFIPFCLSLRSHLLGQSCV